MKKTRIEHVFVLQNYGNYDDLPDKGEIEQLRLGCPDAEQFLVKSSSSYDYIRALPLKNLHENYLQAIPEFFP